MEKRFPFRHGYRIQHVSGKGPIFAVRLVDDEVFEAYAECVEGNAGGTRVIYPENWKVVWRPLE